jgi:N-acetylglucosaminyl-diphospho-decaprenol L-rhamnosyltransferase
MTPWTAVVALHDSAPDLRALLASIDRCLEHRPRVICVDSGSSDDGPQVARDWGADVLVLDGNPGFGAANNAGLERVRTEITVLLNPDIELRDDGIERLVSAAVARDRLYAPRLLNRDGSIQRSAHPRPGTAGALLPAAVHPRLLPRPLRDRADPWRSGEVREVGWAIAAALVARTATLRALGPFDPEAFLFYEDLDLCLRAAALGVPTMLDPTVALLHRGGHSTDAHYGGEPLLVHATRRRAVIEADLGPRALRLDDAAQALTFATRAAVKWPGGRGRRELAQLKALRAARRAK